MEAKPGPLEGKIVVLEYLEVDYVEETTACLVYRVNNGWLKPLLGILDLPQEIGSWHTLRYEQSKEAAKVILMENVTEVYTPYFAPNFLGTKLGHFDLSETLNEKGEIERWCELRGMQHPDILRHLQEEGISVKYVEVDTLEE